MHQNLSGSQWYNQQASRATNQAIGRVIRHVSDFGMILLFDQRYGFGNNRREISSWLRNQVAVVGGDVLLK